MYIFNKVFQKETQHLEENSLQDRIKVIVAFVFTEVVSAGPCGQVIDLNANLIQIDQFTSKILKAVSPGN